MSHRALHATIAATVLIAMTATAARAVVSSNGGANPPLTGTDIGTFVGANTFYSNGYTGSRTIIANIEAGLVWNGAESLSQGQVTQYLAGSEVSGVNGWQTSSLDRHATWVGQIMVGQGSFTYQQGIAFGSQLWSGAIATSWVSAGGGYSENFNLDKTSFAQPFYQAMVTGINASTADVLNVSWYGTTPKDGSDSYSQAMDALIYLSANSANAPAKLVCIAAGNGTFANSVGWPAAGFNGLVVGATGTGTTNYNAVASFSSRSPSDVFDPSMNSGTGQTIANARSRIDIVAPGTTLTLASYGGATGGYAAGVSPYSGRAVYDPNNDGTSFSTPVVTSGAALVVDAGKTIFPGNPKAIDGRVIKAVLMNSATKLSGWNNGQSVVNGVMQTTQSLDNSQGAGQLNLSAAWPQYTAGTTDLPGTSGGSVHPMGWDYGTVPAGSHNDYSIDTPLLGGSMFTITVDWFAHDVINLNSDAPDFAAFDNIDLQVYEVINGVDTLVAQSISKYNSAEHLYFAVPGTGNYVFRILDAGFNWNGYNGAVQDITTDFGVAWNGTAVPEPGSVGVVLCGCAAMLRRRGRVRDDKVTR